MTDHDRINDEAAARLRALASRAPAQALGGVKALEFAEYMAKGAEQLLEAMNEHAAALMALEEGSNEDADVDITEQTLRCERAEQALGEFMTGLRDDVYEFRKRRDRAVFDHRATAQAPEQPVHLTEPSVERPEAVDGAVLSYRNPAPNAEPPNVGTPTVTVWIKS